MATVKSRNECIDVEIDPSGEEYMVNSAGLWQWKSPHWNYIPGTANLGLASNGYLNAPMTVNAQGDLIMAVGNQILQRHNGKSIVISDGHESNVAFLAWMPDGTLVAGLNVFPAPRQTSHYGLGGPAPIPHLKLMGYSNHQWKSIPLNLPKNVAGVRSVALANGSADYLSYQLQSRFFSSLNAYRPLSEAGEFEGDVLILHGSLDHEISPENTFMFDKVFRMRLTGSCKKVIVENGDHVFSSDSVMREVISQTKSWLMKHTHAPHNLPS